MNREDILSINDWIKISIRFSGICLNCKKRLNSGDYGYWSRISKSVLHELCYDSLFFQSSSIKDSSDGIGVSDKNNIKKVNLKGNAHSNSDNGIAIIDSDSKERSKIIKKSKGMTKCFICDKYIDFKNDFIESLLKLSEKYNSNLDILYCYDCLENFNNVVYKNYKKKFMDKI